MEILQTLTILNLSNIRQLLGNTVGDAANGILRNAAIAASLNYLSKFWRSLKIPLINCKVEFKLRWTRCCALSVAGNENNINEDANANNIIFTIKDTQLYVPAVTLSAKDNQTNFLESNFAGVNIFFVLVYTNEGNSAKRLNARKYYLPKSIIKNYSVIINV